MERPGRGPVLVFRKQSRGHCTWSGVTKVEGNGRELHRAALGPDRVGSHRPGSGPGIYTE